jgi:multiple sugar transport system permease protein
VALTFTNSLMTDTELSVRYAAISEEVRLPNDPRANPDRLKLAWVPYKATLSSYYEVLIRKPQYLFMFWNSFLLAVPIILGQTTVASLAGYAFAFLRFRWREPLFACYIVTMLLPFQVTLVPNFIVADKLGLLNTHMAIIGPGVFGAFGVFLLRQYMSSVPSGYIDAARADGASHLRIYMEIVMPMCRPALAALVVLLLVDNWNMVEQPLVMLHDSIKQPLSVYLSAIGEEGRGIAFAACALYMTPMLLVMLYAEQSLLEGIQLSGIKG